MKGTTIGASTDAEGRFSLTLPATTTGEVVLRISSIGFILAGRGSEQRSDKIPPDNKTLDDVVIIGFQPVRRENLTQAISSVSAQQIKDIPVNSRHVAYVSGPRLQRQNSESA